MSNNSLRSRTVLRAALLAVGLGFAGLANAQSAACAANEVTQNLDQAANPWTSGSLTYAANIGAGASAVNITATATGGNWSAGYPQNELTGGIADTFGYSVNRTNTTQSNTVTFTFSKPVNNLRLTMTDIDRSGTTNVYADQVTITGTAPGGGTVTPTATAATALVTVAGNVAFPSATATSGTNCPFTSGDCNATFNFSAPITSFVIVYSNRAPPAANNPPEQQVSSSFGGFCVQNPNPGVTKTAPATGAVGTAFDFALAIGNPGSAATAAPPSALQVTDTINANALTINSITPAAGWSCTPATGFPINAGSVTATCTATGAIAAGTVNQPVATINVTPKAAALPGPVVNTATIPAGSGGDIDNGNNSSSTTTTLAVVADLTLTKTNTPGVNGNVDQSADTVTSGASAVYTITVTNSGPSPANNAVVTDPVPTNLTCATATCTATGGATCPAATGAALVAALQGAGATIPTLPVGGSVAIALNCTVN